MTRNKKIAAAIATAVATGAITAATAKYLRSLPNNKVQVVGPASSPKLHVFDGVSAKPFKQFGITSRSPSSSSGGFVDIPISPSMGRISGKGGYKFRDFGRDVFTGAGTIGGALTGAGAGPYGAAVGAGIGGNLGNELGNVIFGQGDYSVMKNSLIRKGVAIQPGQEVPSFGVLGHATRVRHREFIKDILVPASPLAFTNQPFIINPGNKTTFPWLANLAANYQQYRFEGLVFEFKTLSSDITAGGALGSLMLATNYDVLEAPFTDKVHLENSQYAVSAKPSLSQIHTVECAPSASAQNLWYVRDATSDTLSGDDRFFDLGKFQVATAGLPGSTGAVLGELWASYDVSLFKPEIVNTESTSQRIESGGSVSDTAIFGVTPTSTGSTIVTAFGNTLTFNIEGQFMVVMRVDGTGASSISLGGSAVAVEIEDNTNAATTERLRVYRVVAIAGNTMVFNATAWTTVVASTVRLAPYVNATG